MSSGRELFAEISSQAVVEDGESVGYFVKNCRMDLLERLLSGNNEPVSQGYKLNPPAIPNGWIKCSDRMPEEGDTVLVCQEGGIIFCAEMDNGYLYPDEFPNTPSRGREITHWMPLPTPPAKEPHDV